MPQPDSIAKTLEERAYKSQELVIQPGRGQTACSLEEVLEATKGTGGIQTKVAAKLGVHPSTLTDYKRRWPEFVEALHWEKEARKDVAEDVLWEHVVGGSLIAAMFWNKTQNKDRGYVEASTNVEYLVKLELRRFLTYLQSRLSSEAFDEVVEAIREFKTIEGEVVAGEV